MYTKMYLTMFNAAKEALIQLEQQNYGVAKATLMRAQFECESLFVSAEEPETASEQEILAENDQKQGSES